MLSQAFVRRRSGLESTGDLEDPRSFGNGAGASSGLLLANERDDGVVGERGARSHVRTFAADEAASLRKFNYRREFAKDVSTPHHANLERRGALTRSDREGGATAQDGASVIHPFRDPKRMNHL